MAVGKVREVIFTLYLVQNPTSDIYPNPTVIIFFGCTCALNRNLLVTNLSVYYAGDNSQTLV